MESTSGLSSIKIPNVKSVLTSSGPIVDPMLTFNRDGECRMHFVLCAEDMD